MDTFNTSIQGIYDIDLITLSNVNLKEKYSTNTFSLVEIFLFSLPYRK